MKHVIKKVLFLISLPAAVMVFVSCPQPLTEDDVIAAQDKLAPTIEVLSPGENEVYYSEVEFSLRILDDAENEEDGLGDLASISFDLANDDLRGGRVLIDSDGNISQDSDFGPDEVVYDVETGLVSFNFSTVSPNTITGMISVTISAEDRNGNLTEEAITLADNEGPWLDFTVIDTVSGQERSYTEDTTVRLSGSLGNSAEDQTSADEITNITWSVLGKSWNGKLVIDKSATYLDTETGDTLYYYNSSENRYERLNEGVAYPDLFIYYPATRTFRTDIEIPFGAGTVLPFEVTVTDKNGHETTLTVNAFSDESGPEVIIEFPKDENAYYTLTGGAGGNVDKSDVIEGYINGGIADLQSFKFQIKDSTGEFYTDKLDVSPGSTDNFDAFDISSPYNDDSNDFYIDISNYLTLMQNESGDPYTGGNDVSVTIYAVNDDDFETRPKVQIYEDAEGPEVSIVSFISNHTNNRYANDDRDLTLVFSASDSSTDTDDLVASVSIGNQSGITPSLSSNFTAVSTSGNWGSIALSDDDLPYTITVEDRLGNQTVVTEADSVTEQVMYYRGNPALGALDGTNKVSLSASAPGTDTTIAKANDIISVDITSDRDLETPSGITLSVSGNDYAGLVTQDTVIHFISSATPTVANVANGDVTFSLPVVDKAGNTVTLTGDTAVNYDSQSPLPGSLTVTVTGNATSGAGYINDNDAVSSKLSFSSLLSTDTNYDEISYELKDSGDNTILSGTSSSLDSFDSSTDVSSALDGYLFLTYTLTDLAGNSASGGSSVSSFITLDTTAPTTPAFGLAAGQDSNIDGDGYTNYTGLDMYLEGTSEINTILTLSAPSISAIDNTVYDCTSVTNWSTILNPFTLGSDNDYAISAEAEDPAGNTTTGTFTIHRDTTLIAPIDYQLDNDTSGGSDITNDTSNQTVTVSAEEGSTVSITVDGPDPFVDYTNSGTVSSGSWTSGTFNPTTEGTYNVTVVLTDIAGNNDTFAADYSFEIDTTLDAPTAYALDNDTSGGSDITNDTSNQTVTVSAEEGSTVSITVDGPDPFVDYTNSGTISSGSWTSGTFNPTTEGSYEISVVLTDIAGNNGTFTADYSFEIDTTLDAPTSYALDNDTSGGSDITNDTTNQTVTVSAEEGSTVSITVDGPDPFMDYTNSGTVSSGSWTSGTFNPTTDGTYEVSVVLTDIAGNNDTFTADYSFEIDTIMEAPTAYALDNDTSGGSDITNDTSNQTVTVSAEEGSTVSITVDGPDPFVDYTNSGTISSGSWTSGTFNPTTDGTYDVTVVLTDIAGNNDTFTADYSFEIDTIMEAPTAYALDNDTSGGSDITNDTSNQTVTVSAEEGSTVSITVDGPDPFVDYTDSGTVSSGSWTSGTFNPTTEGTYDVTVVLTDIAGNNDTFTADYSFEIDTIMEAPTAYALDNDTSGGSDITNDTSNQTVTVSAEEGSTVSITVDGPDPFVDYTDSGTISSGSWTSGTFNPTTEGTYDVTVVLTDIAGNNDTYASDYSFEIDTTPPEMTIHDVSSPMSLPTSGGGDTYVPLYFSDVVSGLVDTGTDKLNYLEASVLPANYEAILIDTDETVRLDYYSGTEKADWVEGSYSIDFSTGISAVQDTAGNSVNIDTISFSIDSSGDLSAFTVTYQTGSGMTPIALNYIPEDEPDSRDLSAMTYSDGYSREIVEASPALQVEAEETILPEIDEEAILSRAALQTPVVNIPAESLNNTIETPSPAVQPHITELPEINQETLSFMQEVEQNRADHQQLLSQLRMKNISRQQLRNMDAGLEPVLLEAEELVVYSSPVPTAFDTPVTLAPEDSIVITEDTPSGLILLTQILLAAAIGLLTLGFLRLLGRFQRKNHDPLD